MLMEVLGVCHREVARVNGEDPGTLAHPNAAFNSLFWGIKQKH